MAMLATLAAMAAPGAVPPAHAECGTPVPIDAALLQADAVFVGEVSDLADRNREATMLVLEVWKGRDLPGTVIVRGGSGGPDGFGPDDRTFQLGRTYLVLSDDTRSPFESDRCTATKLYTPLGGRLIPANMAAVVGVSKARAPLSSLGDDGATAEGGMSILPIINIAVVLVGLVAAGYMYKRLSGSRRRVQPRAPQQTLGQPKRNKATTDSVGKLSRRFSLTGMFGRSGLDSSKKLRGRPLRRRVKGGRRG
jgi:hypothetical protein